MMKTKRTIRKKTKKTKNRLFTFGCSFTDYFWPTWADVLGKQFDFYENWGRRGAGNEFITNSIVECGQRNKFTTDDTIAIMWSSSMRDDYYCDNQWILLGQKLSTITKTKQYKGLNNQLFANDNRGCYIRDLGFIFLIKNYLDTIGCKYYFMSIVDIPLLTDKEKKLFGEDLNDVFEVYKDLNLENLILPSVHKAIFNYNWLTTSYYPHIAATDHHPLPLDHLKYTQKVLPYIIQQDTIDWIDEIQSLILNKQDYSHLFTQKSHAPKVRL